MILNKKYPSRFAACIFARNSSSSPSHPQIHDKHDRTKAATSRHQFEEKE
jgi:hypothetical protein